MWIKTHQQTNERSYIGSWSIGYARTFVYRKHAHAQGKRLWAKPKKNQISRDAYPCSSRQGGSAEGAKPSKKNPTVPWNKRVRSPTVPNSVQRALSQTQSTFFQWLEPSSQGAWQYHGVRRGVGTEHAYLSTNKQTNKQTKVCINWKEKAWNIPQPQGEFCWRNEWTMWLSFGVVVTQQKTPQMNFGPWIWDG